MLPTKNHGRCCNLANLINLVLHLPSPLKKMNIKNINLKPDGIAIDVDLNHYARFPAKSGILFFAGKLRVPSKTRIGNLFGISNKHCI